MSGVYPVNPVSSVLSSCAFVSFVANPEHSLYFSDPFSLFNQFAPFVFFGLSSSDFS